MVIEAMRKIEFECHRRRRPRGPESRTPRQSRPARRAPAARPRPGSACARHPGAPPKPAVSSRADENPTCSGASARFSPRSVMSAPSRSAGSRVPLLARLLLGNSRDALTPRQFGRHIGRADPGRRPHHQQMIQHIGALADQRGAVAPGALDDRLDRLLTEFLRDFGLAARQQLRGIGAGRVGAAPRIR